MRYALQLTVPPEVEPLTLGQAKDHCRISPEVTEEDDLITAAIVAARMLAETQMHRQIITQTWTVALDSFPSSTSTSWWTSPAMTSFEIPLSPVQSLTVQYYDANGVLTTLATTAYEWDSFGVRPRFRPAFGSTFPTVASMLGGVRLSVVAGFGDTGADVPASILQWMKCAVASMYEHRELAQEKGQLVMNPFLDGLLDPYRIVEI